MMSSDRLLSEISSYMSDAVFESGFTPAQIGRMLDLGGRTVYRILNREAMPNLYTFYKLCYFLNLSVDDIFFANKHRSGR